MASNPRLEVSVALSDISRIPQNTFTMGLECPGGQHQAGICAAMGSSEQQRALLATANRQSDAVKQDTVVRPTK